MKLEIRADPAQPLPVRPSRDAVKVIRERGNYEAYNKWLSEREVNKANNAGLGWIR